MPDTAVATKPRPASSAATQQPARAPITPNAGVAASENPVTARYGQISNIHTNAAEIFSRVAPYADYHDVNDSARDEAVKRAKEEILYRAMEEGMSLSAWLEEEDPSNRYAVGDPMGQLDAYERQLVLAGIRTRSDPKRGIWAHSVERFYLSDQPASIVLFPEFINRTIRANPLTPPILDELVAVTTPVDSDTYRSIYLDDTVDERQMKRVSEGSFFPKVKLTTAEHPISLHKYGVEIETSYEVMRRIKLDLFSVHVQRIAQQTMLDKTGTAMDVLVNGDGNGNAATNWNLTTLDSGATAGTLSYLAWLKWNMKLWPTALTTVIAGEAELLSVLSLQFPNINPLTLLSMLTEGAAGNPVGQRLELPQGIFNNVRLIYYPDAPSNVLVGLNRSLALEQVLEVGATMTETDKIIQRQFDSIVISEVVGYAQIYNDAIETLTLNA